MLLLSSRHLIMLYGCCLAVLLAARLSAPVQAVTSVGFTATPASPVVTGTPVTLTATVQDRVAVRYLFRAGYVVDRVWYWTTIRTWATGNTATWTPTLAQTYTVQVQVREVISGMIVARNMSFRVCPPLTGVALAAAPLSPKPRGTSITLTATPTGGARVLYMFRAGYVSGGTWVWRQLRMYSLSPTCTWQPWVPARYTVQVYAREYGTTFPLRVASLSYLVTAGTGYNSMDGAEMVYVPAGAFLRGSLPDCGWSNEVPQRSITLSGYWIYKNEVTVAQYRAFCTATGHALPAFPSGYSWTGKTGWMDAAVQQFPIVNVSWNDATAYAAWAGASLPTEAQWEKAARGTDGRNYPWGGVATSSDLFNGWDQTRCANYYNSISVGTGTWPVGSFPTGVSPYGANDMAGNVWEWCKDWYQSDYYTSCPLTDPPGPVTGTTHVAHGGSWADSGYDYFAEDYYRCADRSQGSATTTWYNLGFRCVVSSPGP